MSIREYLEKQKEVYFNIEELIGKLNAIKKKVQQRDVLCLEYDKWKSEVAKLSAKGGAKDQAKFAEAEKKRESHKEQYEKINAELVAEIKLLYNSRFQDFGTEYKLAKMVLLQRDLFFSCASAFKTGDVVNVQIPPSDLASKLKLSPVDTKPQPTKADDRPKSVQKPPSRPPPRPTAPKKEDAVEQYPQDQNPFENFETKQ